MKPPDHELLERFLEVARLLASVAGPPDSENPMTGADTGCPTEEGRQATPPLDRGADG